MKELSIEEKAKRYDKALEIAREWSETKNGYYMPKELCEEIFPELTESEDERIRKELLEHCKNQAKPYIQTGNKCPQIQSWIAWLEKQSTPQVRTGLEWVNTIDDACDKRYSEEYAHGEYCHEQSFKWGFQEGVEWLEKQGEQKPAWSEEDEYYFGIIQYILNNECVGKADRENATTWFKSLKDRVQPQNSSVTDEELAQAKKEAYNEALDKIEYNSGEPTFDDGWSAAIWYLKKRNGKPQNRWKPSDKQMEVLWKYAEQNNYDGMLLTSLYNDLKKLREE